MWPSISARSEDQAPSKGDGQAAETSHAQGTPSTYCRPSTIYTNNVGDGHHIPTGISPMRPQNSLHRGSSTHERPSDATFMPCEGFGVSEDSTQMHITPPSCDIQHVAHLPRQHRHARAESLPVQSVKQHSPILAPHALEGREGIPIEGSKSPQVLQDAYSALEFLEALGWCDGSERSTSSSTFEQPEACHNFQHSEFPVPSAAPDASLVRRKVDGANPSATYSHGKSPGQDAVSPSSRCGEHAQQNAGETNVNAPEHYQHSKSPLPSVPSNVSPPLQRIDGANLSANYFYGRSSGQDAVSPSHVQRNFHGPIANSHPISSMAAHGQVHTYFYNQRDGNQHPSATPVSCRHEGHVTSHREDDQRRWLQAYPGAKAMEHNHTVDSPHGVNSWPVQQLGESHTVARATHATQPLSYVESRPHPHTRSTDNLSSRSTLTMGEAASSRSEFGTSTSSNSRETASRTQIEYMHRQLYPCRYCPERYTSAASRKTHTIHKHQDMYFDCPICGSSYLNEHRLLKHVGEKHTRLQIDQLTNYASCNYCGKVLLSNGGWMNKHILTKHSKQRSLSPRRESCVTRRESHRVAEGSIGVGAGATKSKGMLAQKQKVVEYDVTKTGTTTDACESDSSHPSSIPTPSFDPHQQANSLKGQSSASSRDLSALNSSAADDIDRARRLHEIQSSTTSRDLSAEIAEVNVAHLRKPSPVRDVTCLHCEAKFSTRGGRNAHMRAHHTEQHYARRVSCPICNEKFKTKRQLYVHAENTHSRDEISKCVEFAQCEHCPTVCGPYGMSAHVVKMHLTFSCTL